MADLLRIKAANGDQREIRWDWVDSSMAACAILLDHVPQETIRAGDVWHAELVGQETQSRRKIARLRLVAKIREMPPWAKITELSGFWIPPQDLQTSLIWLHEGTDFILIGPKGAGKTSLPFHLATALGWQEPNKVDVYTIRRTTDLFGTDSAEEGTALFRRSSLYDYIERAQTALQHGLETHFIVILDEINRVHAKANEAMHGLFDDTRQVTVITAEGSKIIRIPPNVHFMGTMNVGHTYLGTFELDAALKDRFAPLKLSPMPLDYEVAKLVKETNILEAQALAIVQVARTLREAEDGGQLTMSPSYRGCRNAARLVAHGMEPRQAIITAFLGWYGGALEFDERGEPRNPSLEVAKAYAALRMKLKMSDIVVALRAS